MPKVPEFNKKPLNITYNPTKPNEPATLKQKNYILTLCERRKIDKPDLTKMTIGEAAQFISNMVNV